MDTGHNTPIDENSTSLQDQQVFVELSESGVILPDHGNIEPEHNMAFSCPVDHAGIVVYVQGWARVHSEWPPVIFVHDLGENVELYEPAAKFLLRRGFNTFSFDMRGHGRSSPLAGKMVSFDDLVSDLLQVIAWIRYKSQRRTPFLIGQGVGALLLLHFQKTYPQHAPHCILLAPVYQEHTALPAYSRALIHTMAVLAPQARLPRFLLPYFLPMSDDMNLRGSDGALMISAGFAQELLQAIRAAMPTIQELQGKNLIVCPLDDTFYNSRRLRELIAYHAKPGCLEIAEVPGISAQAITHDENELTAFLQVVIPWMQNHSKRMPAA